MSAQWRSSNTQDDRARRREPLEERPPARRTARSRPPAGARPPRAARAAPARSSVARPRRARARERLARCASRVVASSSVSSRPRAGADHLAQRPERDALAVRRAIGPRASRPSRRGRRGTSGTPRRGGSCRCPPGPMTETSRTRRSRDVAWNRSLSRRSSVVAADERGLEARRRGRGRRRSATTRSARHAGTGATLPLSSCSPAGSNAMAALAAPLRRLADEHRRRAARPTAAALPCSRGRPRPCPGLVAPSVTAASPVSTPAPGLDAGPERLHGVDELEGRPDRPLGVVLVRDRRAPDGHDRVADELLDACRRSAR